MTGRVRMRVKLTALAPASLLALVTGCGDSGATAGDGKQDGDNQSQVDAIENLIGAGATGILITPNDSKVIVPSVDSRVVIMDDPTAALGVRESRAVLDLVLQVRDRGLPVILISHNMPHVFEVADRIHIQRLGWRKAVVDPKTVSMSDAVAIMTGAMELPRNTT